MVMSKKITSMTLLSIYLFGCCLAYDSSGNYYTSRMEQRLKECDDLIKQATDYIKKTNAAVFKSELTEKVKKAVDEIIMDRGINPEVKSKASEEYEKRIQNTIDSLNQLMLNKNQTYVSLLDIENMVKEKFEGFVNKPIETPKK